MDFSSAHNADYQNYLNGGTGTTPPTGTPTGPTTTTTGTPTGPTIVVSSLHCQDQRHSLIHNASPRLTTTSLWALAPVVLSPQIVFQKPGRRYSLLNVVDPVPEKLVVHTLHHGLQAPTYVFLNSVRKGRSLTGFSAADEVRYPWLVRVHVHRQQSVVLVQRFASLLLVIPVLLNSDIVCALDITVFAGCLLGGGTSVNGA